MGKIPPIRFVNEENFKEKGAEWFLDFLRPFNDFVRSIILLFTNGITFADNCVCVYKEVSFELPAAGTYSAFPIPLAWPYKQVTPQECVIVKITSSGTVDGVVVAGGVPDWSYHNGQVMVYGLRSSLTTGLRYTVRFRISA